MDINIDRIARWLAHDVGCEANDFDFLDKTPCKCGLRTVYNPNGRQAETPHEYERHEPSYREYQERLRAAGWNAYNSDYVDEFGQW